jgi:hypothetical protein
VRRGPGDLSLHKLNVERDGYSVANEYATGFERGVPIQAEIFTADFQDEFRRKSLTKHRSKKLLGRRKAQYFKEKGPVNVRVASVEDTVL